MSAGCLDGSHVRNDALFAFGYGGWIDYTDRGRHRAVYRNRQSCAASCRADSGGWRCGLGGGLGPTSAAGPLGQLVFDPVMAETHRQCSSDPEGVACVGYLVASAVEPGPLAVVR